MEHLTRLERGEIIRAVSHMAPGDQAGLAYVCLAELMERAPNPRTESERRLFRASLSFMAAYNDHGKHRRRRPIRSRHVSRS
jgi:hypothetical protein